MRGIPLLVLVFWSCAPKEKITPFEAPPKTPIYLVLGFHGRQIPQEQVWENYALAHLVARSLRLAYREPIWLDPAALVEFFPGMDTRLFQKLPEAGDLREICRLLQCDLGFYVSYVDEGARKIQVWRFNQKDWQSLSENTLPREDLLSQARFAVETILQDLGANPPEDFSQRLRRLLPSTNEGVRLYIMGLYFLEVGWYNKAMTYFEELNALEPDFAQARIKLAEIYLLKDYGDRALRVLKPLEKEREKDFYYWYLVGRSYHYLRDAPRAEEALRKSVSLNDQFQEASLLLAIVTGQLGKRQQQRQAVRMFIRTDPLTGTEIRRAMRYLRQFSRRPDVQILANKLSQFQALSPYFVETQRALRDEFRVVGSWFLGRLRRTLRGPTGIAISPEGVFVADEQAHEILLLSEDGVILESFTHPELNRPSQLVWVPPNSVYIADPFSSNIFHLDTKTGTLEKIPAQFVKEISRPTGIAYIDGLLYVSDTGLDVLWVLKPTGEEVRKISVLKRGLNQEAAPAALVATPEKTLIIADKVLDRIYEMDLQGKVLRTIATSGFGPDEVMEPLGLALDGNRVFVTDPVMHQVRVFTRDGQILAVFGGYGTGEGYFNKPAGVAITPDGRILVTDRDNGRIQIFAPRNSE